ncbi:MAG: FKBP-type peptidyl-prolyl cis-trans isomerase [Bacteroidetes bacterium]|nr:FKBP-type peptidyl-prolyl cis-trans isomerase [Bacteroidota bacterium]
MKRKSILLAACFSFSALVSCEGQKGSGDVTMKSKTDSVAYAIGVTIGANMKKDGLDSLNLDILSKAIRHSIKGDSLLFSAQQSQGVIQAYLQEKQKQKADVNIAIGKKFLDENKSKPGVKALPDGLQYLVMKEGTGPIPTATDTVTVHYHGTLLDGTVFESSVDKGQPIEYPVGGFIKGWQEALQMMKVGSKWKLFIPSELAYGDRASGPKIQPNSTLIFEMELLAIKGK